MRCRNPRLADLDSVSWASEAILVDASLVDAIWVEGILVETGLLPVTGFVCGSLRVGCEVISWAGFMTGSAGKVTTSIGCAGGADVEAAGAGGLETLVKVTDLGTFVLGLAVVASGGELVGGGLGNAATVLVAGG